LDNLGRAWIYDVVIGRMGISRRHVLAILALLALLLLRPALARADAWDDVERRLKTSGVAPALARQIAHAVRLGAERLVALQQRDGSYAGGPGATALVALALVHTGDPKARTAAERARRWLQGSRRVLGRMRRQTYEAGLMAMLLQALAPRDPLLAELHDRLARGCTGEGYWGYAAAGESGVANLSTSQFACLGMWAAERAGVPRAELAWRTHAEGLLKAQDADGSWGYLPGVHSLGHTYAAGTCMGLADLVLAQGAERPEQGAAAVRGYALEWARRAGRAGLARHVRWILGPAGPGLVAAGPSEYYTFYAIEKASVFLGAETLGGLDWYARGARILVASQDAQGDFGALRARAAVPPAAGAAGSPASGITAAFALLFLLRASEVYRPVTPRAMPTGRPRGPVTGATPAPAPAPAPPAPDPVAPGPPLPLAMRVLVRIEARSRALRMADVPELQHLLGFVRRTLPRYLRDGHAVDPLHEAWVRRAEQALVALGVPALRDPSADQPWRLVLATDALATLAHATARGGASLRDAVPLRAFSAAQARHLSIAWYAALFDCLRATHVPGVGAWIVGQAVWPDVGRAAMTIPALGTLSRLAPPDAASRRRLARLLLTKLKPLDELRSEPGPGRDLQWDALQAVLCLVGADDPRGPSGLAAYAAAGPSLAAWRARLGSPR
jgi:hypothetical protein